MPTSFDVLYNAFFRKIERDMDFFNYLNVSEQESMAIARDRARNYLQEALVKLVLACDADVDFMDTDEERFNVDLTDVEIDLIACLMFEAHLSRDIARLRAQENNYVPKTFRYSALPNRANRSW